MSTESVFAVLTLPIVFFIAGNGFLICANALSKVLPKLISIWSQKTKEPVLLLAILSVFNVSAMMNMILILPISVVALPVETCWSVNFAQNFTVLTYVVLFDWLILYKSYIATRRNRYFLVISCVSFCNDLVWSVADLMWSGGVWDAEGQSCSYHQNELSGFNTSLASIICDAIGTTGAIYAFVVSKSYLLPFGSLFHHIVKENVFRSVWTLTIGSILAWVNTIPSVEQNILYITYISFDVTLFCLMNLEIFWKEVRDKEYTSSATGKDANVVRNSISSGGIRSTEIHSGNNGTLKKSIITSQYHTHQSAETKDSA